MNEIRKFFFHTCVMICNFVLCVKKITFSLNDCVINYRYLVLKQLWSCWQARSHHKMFSGRERKKKGVWKFVWNKMQMEMKFCVEQKKKRVEKNNASHIDCHTSIKFHFKALIEKAMMHLEISICCHHFEDQCDCIICVTINITYCTL